MHFWIDKRSQICGHNGRYAIPPSLGSGRRRRRRRHKLMIPVHRFGAIENGAFGHQFQRSLRRSATESRVGGRRRMTDYQRAALEHELSNSSSAMPRLNPEPQVHSSGCADTPSGIPNTMPQSQLIRLGGLTKYGMWASFGLTTISVAATKFYVDHQGIFEILLLCTLGVLGAGLLISCLLTAYRRNTNLEMLSVQTPMLSPPASTTELVIPDTSNAEMIISPQTVTTTSESTNSMRTSDVAEQRPPPYDIAIYLPIRDFMSPDYPPPSYENAVR